jgi:nicotinamidase-related amidase
MSTALLVVDMLNDFVHGVLGNPVAREIVDPIARLAGAARERDDWLVVYANDAHLPDDFELRVFPPHAMAGTEGAQVIEELRPADPDVVVGKRAYSAFTGTTLEQTLHEHGVGHVVIVGQHTDCCVRHTSYDAFVRGLEITVCPDATVVFQPGSEEPVDIRQTRALEYLRTYYGAQTATATTLL